jgi:GDPmannose 4,6-dehydratase
LPTALVTGIAGQDGSYLADLLLTKGYRVVGLTIPLNEVEKERIRHLEGKVEILEGSLADTDRILSIVGDLRPDEIYNFAAFSFLSASIHRAVEAADLLALSVVRILEAVRAASPSSRFFQASSSEIFGNPAETPQAEGTPFRPRNPYGAAKLYGHLIVGNYRSLHGIHASSGILYNHESPRRGIEFVTRKVCRAAAAIRLGLEERLVLGSLDARRDWGFAGDYVDAMWRMLQREEGDDYVVATGETHSVRELCEEAFGHLGLDWAKHVATSEDLMRPPDVGQLVGDPSKARRLLGWEPTVSFRELVRMMVDADVARLSETPEPTKEKNP